MGTVHATSAPRSGRHGGPRRAFTLVELLVVIVIVMLLGSLTLGGLFSARRRIQIDKTRNTIRKIHEIVMPQYEGYLRRRVPAADALSRLYRIRRLMAFELPDSWGDVLNGMPDVLVTGSTWEQTGPVLAYAMTKSLLVQSGLPFAQANGSAECLYMIVSCGSGEPDAMERFRADEVGDKDKDGAPEFLDAWGNPIGFVRWAPGASSPLKSGTAGLNSPVQIGDPTRFHDPLDPMRKDLNGFALLPLIVSSGPDQTLGLVTTGTGGWLTDANVNTVSIPASDGRHNTPSSTSITGSNWQFSANTGFSLKNTNTPVSGAVDAAAPANSWADNVTNHDLMKK